MSKNQKTKSNYEKTKNEELKVKLINIRNLTKSKKFNQAYKELENLKEEYENNHYYIFECGVYYYENKNLEKALNLFESLLSSTNRYYALYYIGKINSRKKLFDEAEKNFIEIINSNNSNDKDYSKLELCKIYKYKNNLSKALKIIDELMENCNERIYNSALLEKAEIMCSSKKYDECEKIVKSIIKKLNYRKQIDKALMILATNEFEKGEFANSEKYLKKVKDYGDKECFLRAKIEFEKNNFVNFIKICDQLLEIPEYTDESRILLAKLYIKIGDLEKAENILKKFIEKNKEYLNYYLGIIELKKQNFPKAKEYFDICINKNCYNYDTAILKEIYMYIEQNNLEEAYNYYKFLKKENFFIGKFYDEGYCLELYFATKFNYKSNLVANSYKKRQIVNYDKKLAIKHIMEHTEEQEGKHSVFNKEIDILQLLEYVKENINKDTFVSNRFFNEYLIEYDNVGYSNNIIQNYIKVITLPNSKDIITMYPFPKYDINYNEEDLLEKENYTTYAKNYKRLSQIEKFNKRYIK